MIILTYFFKKRIILLKLFVKINSKNIYVRVHIVSTKILFYLLENKINYSFNKSKKGKYSLEIDRIAVKLLVG